MGLGKAGCKIPRGVSLTYVSEGGAGEMWANPPAVTVDACITSEQDRELIIILPDVCAVSAANYFSEILEWSGYALAAQSLPAVAFAFYTFCNVAPRGLKHHRSVWISVDQCASLADLDIQRCTLARGAFN